MIKGIRIKDQHGEIHRLCALDCHGNDWTMDFSPRSGYGQLGSSNHFEYDEDQELHTGDIDDIKWWRREIEAYHDEYDRRHKYTRTGFSNLDELMDYLQESEVAGWHWHQDPVKWDEMPSFGGDAPAETIECWSWDVERVLVGRHAHDLQIMTRLEWAEFHQPAATTF